MAYRSATRCHICEKCSRWTICGSAIIVISPVNSYGPAHSNCNLNYKNSFYIPIVFHNLSGYDAHFIIKEIATAYDGHVNLLSITKKKYVYTKHVQDTIEKESRNCIKLRFIDSYKFLSTSIDKLASYLDKDELKIIRSEFCKLNAENFDILTRRDIFPYEYVNCVEKFDAYKLFYSWLTVDTG